MKAAQSLSRLLSIETLIETIRRKRADTICNYEKIALNQWAIHPEYFVLNPNQFLVGLNNYGLMYGWGFVGIGCGIVR